MEVNWYSGYGPYPTKIYTNSLWVQYPVKSFNKIIQRLTQGCPEFIIKSVYL